MYPNIKYINNRLAEGYDIAFCSEIGKRESQQDSAFCYADDEHIYAAVCDGMGGLGGGEIASRIAVETAERAIKEQVRHKRDDPAWLSEAIVSADYAVHALKHPDGSPLNSGTTMVSVYIQNHMLHWASAGDSRAYLFHGEESFQLTTDLNYNFVLDQQLESGEISRQQYQRELTMGEALTSYAGMGNLDVIDRSLNPLELCRGDVIMLCSDGLYRVIEPSWMCDILTACDTLADAIAAVRQIIEEYGNKYQDNFTCILIQVNQ